LCHGLQVEIDLSKVKSKKTDLSTDKGRLDFLETDMSKNFARSSKELLIEKYVPPSAIRVVK